MKKIFLLSLILLGNLYAVYANEIQFFSQDSNVESNSLESESGTFETTESDNGDPFPVTPINDYLPLLAVAAVGLGFYYRKELNQTIKSN